MKIAIAILYTGYAILNYMANHEMNGYERSIKEKIQVFFTGFLCTPFAIVCLIKALIEPGDKYLNLAKMVRDPNFERNAWIFSILFNLFLVGLWIV